MSEEREIDDWKRALRSPWAWFAHVLWEALAFPLRWLHHRRVRREVAGPVGERS